MGNILVINDIEQVINYFVLPQRQTDSLYINSALIIHEEIENWVVSKNKANIYLIAPATKYTFKMAYVKDCIVVINRYGQKSRDFNILFSEMHFGLKN